MKMGYFAFVQAARPLRNVGLHQNSIQKKIRKASGMSCRMNCS